MLICSHFESIINLIMGLFLYYIYIFLVGYKHGFYCIGCCWALMFTLFALGVMNIMWVMVLTIFVLFEKLSYKNPLLFRRVAGYAFIIWGILLVY